ncbi:type I-B CRISPR-associated endonuclease Cas1b [Effusibacillus lacus]|uniref:CRISPR-associated endonuclease Cas1 n=1 Tax=Effusibacillus lacus TaxID=1348429 RepID=A0A292YQD3_9BACL|nr:type I-B CRISPR-associated endonuclease Cas1b [Effusibacillus lacus]TCS68783.1 CRISPR-associated protein Cas1 [Effusibacillus lacus]GAX90700.1 subtype I-B CRISPR-associated endonuclease Cas1 [Effusibacillus lacus]
MKKSIYIFSTGTISRKDNTLCFETDEGKKYIPVEDTKEIFLFGEVDFNKRLLEFLAQKEILLHLYNHYGYYTGSFYPREHLNSGYMILHQAKAYLDEVVRMQIARSFVSGALQNMNQVLRYYENRGLPLGDIREGILALGEGVPDCQTVEQLMAVEGNCREKYYQSFDRIIDEKNFVFEGRSRRPPLNRLNALISFGNSILYTVVLSEIYKTHLDPRIGFLHATNFRRFSLNLDIAEIFKPILVDRVIFTLLSKKMITAKDFEKKMEGIILNEKGRRTFLQELEKRLTTTVQHRDLNRTVSYRTLIRMEAYKLQKHLIGEKEYKPFVSRW